jgi:hypothetical protein
MATENRIKLTTKHLTQKILIHTKNKEIPIQVSWSKIHGSSETSLMAFATTVLSKKEDYAKACSALTNQLYGTDIANKDWTRPLLRFIPLAMLKIKEDANDKLIQSQLAFEKNLITFMPHNLRGLEEMIFVQGCSPSK